MTTDNIENIEIITTLDILKESPVLERPQIEKLEQKEKELGNIFEEVQSPVSVKGEPQFVPDNIPEKSQNYLTAKSHVRNDQTRYVDTHGKYVSKEEFDPVKAESPVDEFDAIKKATLNNVDWKDDRTYLFECPVPSDHNVTPAGITKTKPATLKRPAYDVPICDIFPAIVGHYTVKQFIDDNTSDNSFMKASSQTYVVVKWVDGDEIHTACVPLSAVMVKT